ncbi:UDP-N-acetylmuramate dehydrogenase [Treponema sp.]
MATVRKLLEKINISTGFEELFEGEIRFDEMMAAHTTFNVGGKADIWIRPEGKTAVQSIALLLEAAKKACLPHLILGGGANVVVADRGVRGLVIDTSGLVGCHFEGDTLRAGAGTSVDKAAEACAERSLSGLEFLAGMPGSIGGAVYMNARCYGYSISDILIETEILDENYERRIVPLANEDFSYKKSPFQNRPVIILSALFRLARGNEVALRSIMAQHRADREAKGHYRLPSAGSSFKNDYSFGKPTGQIVDELGLRGLSVGGARVAPWHGNIIVNEGSATASDIRALTELIAEKVWTATGLKLECEILFVGEWD